MILRCSEAISIDDARLRRSSATEKETTFTALESPLKQDEKIYVAGHTGMAGAALVQALRRSGYQNLIYFTGDELDLLDQHAVLDFYYQ
ncbi:MAG TPA: NAD-dependent epimerase/dehydratase family protein, partial [bacterium]|nr:NAD-dependent epimerase/dehydratase family protein [bacterium]